MEPKWIWNARARKGLKIWVANLHESWLVKVKKNDEGLKVTAWAEVDVCVGANGTS